MEIYGACNAGVGGGNVRPIGVAYKKTRENKNVGWGRYGERGRVEMSRYNAQLQCFVFCLIGQR